MSRRSGEGRLEKWRDGEKEGLWRDDELEELEVIKEERRYGGGFGWRD